MSVEPYELDREVFNYLQEGVEQINDWQGAASGIAEYVATWGVERFWAMSRSLRLRGGGVPDSANETDEQKRRYFAWGVARVVLCELVQQELQVKAEMDTQDFQNQFRGLDLNQQVLLVDLLMEIADTIQFWTMRLKDAKDSQQPA
ncbi:hypothetical protein PN462_17980 [Spirulina sp. CS-785/01]|uniref:hypothetical protein n=1 Tax=Spirulina sp. CS-785/01 TaxID=3021716 RepID=UPI00232D9FBB|nr:hypothetical protein [Spirulina sp. CS-785/01]MDB9315008.1 hypothetical protein [Spirulina sp. CS-785/01]